MPADPVLFESLSGLLAVGYRIEVFRDPDCVEIRRPDMSLAFRISRKGSPPAEYESLIEQLRRLHRETTDA